MIERTAGIKGWTKTGTGGGIGGMAWEGTWDRFVGVPGRMVHRTGEFIR